MSVRRWSEGADYTACVVFGVTPMRPVTRSQYDPMAKDWWDRYDAHKSALLRGDFLISDQAEGLDDGFQ